MYRNKYSTKDIGIKNGTKMINTATMNLFILAAQRSYFLAPKA